MSLRSCSVNGWPGSGGVTGGSGTLTPPCAAASPGGAVSAPCQSTSDKKSSAEGGFTSARKSVAEGMSLFKSKLVPQNLVRLRPRELARFRGGFHVVRTFERAGGRCG